MIDHAARAGGLAVENDSIRQSRRWLFMERRRLAAALAAKEAECERLRGALRGVEEWFAKSSLTLDRSDIQTGINMRNQVAAALAPPPGEAK
jgi:hypothetical protein